MIPKEPFEIEHNFRTKISIENIRDDQCSISSQLGTGIIQSNVLKLKTKHPVCIISAFFSLFS